MCSNLKGKKGEEKKEDSNYMLDSLNKARKESKQ